MRTVKDDENENGKSSNSVTVGLEFGEISFDAPRRTSRSAQEKGDCIVFIRVRG